jgi:hypothetical protein
MAALEALPDDVLLAILQRLSTDDDLLGVRCASRRLRQQGAAAVRSLVATGGKLPAAAWRAFPGATRLVVLLDEATSAESLRGLATALPSRLTRLMVQLARPPHPRAVPEGSEAALAAALSDHFVPQLLASPTAAGLQEAHFSNSITSAAAEQLLRGLPSLKHAHLKTTSLEAPPAAAVALQHFPLGLTSLRLHHNQLNGVDLNAAALAACSGLQSLHMKLLTGSGNNISSLGSLAALTSLQALALHFGFGTLAAQLAPELQVQLPARSLSAGRAYRHVVAAASQLPLLQDLDLRDAYLPLDSREPAWAQLASMRSLRRLAVWKLEVVPQQPVMLGSAPTTLAITSLKLHAGICCRQAPVSALQPGSLVALLPELRQLDVKSRQDKASDCSECSIATALQGHQQLQELRVDCGRPRRPQEEQLWRCWAPGRRPLSSMPRLRLLHLASCTRLGLDELLSDAAGCPELQELEVVHSNADPCSDDLAVQEEAPTGRGLAALAGGACRGQLRRLVLVLPGLMGRGSLLIGDVAVLLGGCQQLEYLRLQLQLDLSALGGLLLQQQQQQLGAVESQAALEVQQERWRLGDWDGCLGSDAAATAGMMWDCMVAGEVSDELEEGIKSVGALLEQQLGALGVVGAELGVVGAELGFVRLSSTEWGGECLHALVKGWVGDCAVVWALCAK